MVDKYEYGTWVLVLFVVHRIYLMNSELNQVRCIGEGLMFPVKQFGNCTNGVRHYYDANGQKTPYKASCGDLLSDAMSQLNCANGDLAQAQQYKLMGHLAVLALDVVVFFLPLPAIVFRFVTTFLAFITINGTLFGTPLLLVFSAGISLFGDTLINSLAFLTPSGQRNHADPRRSRDGRFIHRAR